MKAICSGLISPIQCRVDCRKICFLVWPLQCADCSSTHRKDLKLGQCLDIDAIKSPSKFGKVTGPSSHFIGHPVFCRAAFYCILQFVL